MLQECNAYLKERFRDRPGGKPFRVLEAGGGSFSHFVVPDNAQVTTVDIEFGQLTKNNDAHYCIQGDIHSMPVKPHSMDMIICFNVIEHLEDPDTALENFNELLKPGGLLVLGCPDRNSLKGVITRLTPIGFHRWYYRYIVGKKDRGDGHYDAFPTPFKGIVAAAPLRAWCRDRGFRSGFFRAYDGAKAFQISVGSPIRCLVSTPYYAITGLGRLLTLNRWQGDLSDLLIVAEKQN